MATGDEQDPQCASGKNLTQLSLGCTRCQHFLKVVRVGVAIATLFSIGWVVLYYLPGARLQVGQILENVTLQSHSFWHRLRQRPEYSCIAVLCYTGCIHRGLNVDVFSIPIRRG